MERVSEVFRSITAQKAGEEISLLGEPAILKLVSPQEKLSTHESLGGLMACEVVASSLGNGKHLANWCYFAEEWLQKTGYKAPSHVIRACLNFIKIIENDVQEEDLGDLVARLDSKPITTTKRAPARVNARKFSAELKTWPIGAYYHSGKFGCHDLGVEHALAALSCRSVKSISVYFPGAVSLENITAVRLLLHGWKNRLEKIDIRACLRHKIADSDPHHLWQHSAVELAEIPKLKFIESHYLQCDGCNFLRVKSKYLRVIRLLPGTCVRVSEDDVRKMIEKWDMLSVAHIRSELIEPAALSSLRADYPDIIFGA